MSEARIIDLEEQLAHLARSVEDLSDVVARLDTDNALLRHRIQMLMEREAEREISAGGTAILADQKPPHW